MRPTIDPLEPRRLFAGDILFIHGAERSGGFIEATNDAERTEQLASIDNGSTAAGNHGWKQLADLLRGQGYRLTEIDEPLETGAPSSGQTTGAGLNLVESDLTPFDAVVFASNNGVYSTQAVDAVEAYIRGGGGALFISDGNFGSDWRDAPASDTQFLSRFGLSVNQDNGTYTVSRSGGDFAEPDHPVLFGVDAFDGEGVSPIRLPVTAPDGVTITRIAGAQGTTYDNNGTNAGDQFRGTARPVDGRDASLVLANAGAGRLAAYFDRNTFFNTNGAGTDLSRFDNRQLATNLFNWVSDRSPPAVVSSDFTQADPYVLTYRMDDNLNGTFTRSDIRLRNRRTGVNLPGSAWSLKLDEGNGYTDVTITLRSDTPLGPYQLRVERRQMADDSGNVRNGAIRYAFTLLPLNRPQSLRPATAATVSDTPDDDRWVMSLLQ